MASTSRSESNRWLRQQARHIEGRVLSIGSGDDSDGEGHNYRSYFSYCSSYTTSEVAQGFGTDLVIDVRHMPEIPDDSYDCIFCSGVLEHVDDYKSALREITRILKPGGTLLLGTPFRQAIHLAPTDFWRFTEYGLRLLLDECGYQIDELAEVGTDPQPQDRFPATYWLKCTRIREDAKIRVFSHNSFFSQPDVNGHPDVVSSLRDFDPDLASHIDQPEIEGVRQWEYTNLLTAFSDFQGKKILDIGCGRSLFSLYLASLGAQVTTFDLPNPLQSQDEAIQKRARIGVDHLQGSMLDMPFTDGSFDLVISISAIEHLQENPGAPRNPRPRDGFLRDTRQSLREMVRVTKPGGHIFLTTDIYDPVRQKTDMWRPGCPISCAYTPAELKSTFLDYLPELGLTIDGPCDYDFYRAIADDQRSTYRGRYFSTFALLMRRSDRSLINSSDPTPDVSLLTKSEVVVGISPSSRKLEIGSGTNPHPGYEHLDIREDLPHIEHVHDFNNPLPFPEGTFDEILSHSSLEHVSWRNVTGILRNWLRVLKPGGALRIWMPDLEYLARNYLAGKMDQHLDPAYIPEITQLLGDYTPGAWAIVKLFGGQDYPDNFHAAVYDFGTFASILKTAGFERIQRIEPSHGLAVIAYRALQDQEVTDPAHDRQSTEAGKSFPASLPSPGKVHLVIADEGWILETMAREIERRLPYVSVGSAPDPTADLNYYVNYSACRGPRTGLEAALFTHIEERSPAAQQAFFETARRVDHRVCMSRPYAEALMEKGMDCVRVITPGVDLDKYQPVVRIGVVGRTYHTGRKGEDLLRQVMDVPGIEWHFTGDGWPGPARYHTPEEMPKFYNSVDYVLVPSYYEGGPMCVLEALACGKEVIAPPVGFVQDYPHIEFRTGDPADLRRVLQQLVAKRSKLRESVAHRSWNAWANEHDRLFREILTDGVPQRSSSISNSAQNKIHSAPKTETKKLRVLMAMHAPEATTRGGPTVRVARTAAELRKLGLSVDITSENKPNASGYDLVHVFNVWEPNAALDQLRHLKQFGVPVVFSPIYLDLSETIWAERAFRTMFRDAPDSESLETQLRQMADGSLLIDGVARGSLLEIVPNYFSKLEEMAELSDLLIALGKKEMDQLWTTGVRRRPYRMVHNGTDFSRFLSATPDAFCSRYSVRDYVLCVGRLETRKNQLMLARALRGTGIPLVLIGQSPEPEYAELISRHGENITFIDHLNHDDELLASAYAGARVFCLPSWVEGAPLSALEAAAVGTALVLSDRASEKEYFGSLARYCDPASVYSIREQVLTAYEQDARDAERRSRLRGLVAAHFTWEHAAKETLAAYQYVLDSTPHGSVRVHIAGPFFNFSGYARLARETALALDNEGFPVSVFSVVNDQQFISQVQADQEQADTWNKLLGRDYADGVSVCFHVPTLWAGENMYAHFRRSLPQSRAHVGITMFETDRLPEGWADACNGMDEVWVPCEFNRKTFAEAGVSPERLHVIPFGIDAAQYDPSTVPAMKIEGKRGFTFLSTFQWNKRKGWDVLLKAYLSAFTAADDVCLVLRTYPDRIKTPPIRERIDQYIRTLGHDPAHTPAIILLEEFLSDEEMPSLYAAADAFVLPTRGEGWGIPFMEAMATGLPTIGTRWSSHLDFMNDDNSYLIDIEGLAPVDAAQTEENLFYTPDQLWAEPSVAHTAALMRHVFENREEARARGERARRYIQEQWSLERTAKWIIGRVTRLSEAAQVTPARGVATTEARPVTSTVPGSRPLSVLWHGAIYDPSGYADEARHFVLKLREQGVGVAARAIGRHSDVFRGQLDRPTQQALDEALAGKVAPGFISLIHFPAAAFRPLPEAAYRVGRTMFETDGLPADWVAKCNQMDEVWVPSDFNLETFRAAGVTTRLFKVPGGVDSREFRPGLEPLPIPGAHGTIFVSVFEWLYRKGWDVLLTAWSRAFAPTDDVTLVLRTYPANATEAPNVKEEIERRIDLFLQESLGLRRDQVATIIVIGDQIPERDMPRLFAAAHAYLAPSRGEGWGRPQMQAMACGLPVLATRWSGNLEFMNDRNSLLIDVAGLVPIDERMEFANYRGQRWAEPSVDSLVALLRRVVAEPEEMARIGREARQEIEERWDWEKVAIIAADRLRAISAELAQGQASSPPEEKPLAIRWEGSQFVHHSLALVNREVCLQLADAGQEVSIIPYEPDQFDATADARFPKLAARHNAPLSRPANVHVRHQWPPNFEPPKEGHWVMIQPWEFGSIPREWIENMKAQVDEVWAYTNFVRDCYINSGMPAERVHVVPLGVDTERFCPDAPSMKLHTKKSFRFLFVGGTIHRKGVDVLLSAYLHSFRASDDVCLVIKDMGGKSFYKGQTAEETIRSIQANPEAPEILYLNEDIPDADIPGLYTACDCLVHPYRGEGFALPIAEAMACGLPVIVTGAGACLDFCDETVAYLIPSRKQVFPDRRVGHWETVDQPYLFEPDANGVGQFMRGVFENQEEARAVGARGRQRIAGRFTWKHAAEQALRRMQQLSEKPILRFLKPSPSSVSLVIADRGDISRERLESLIASTAGAQVTVMARAAMAASWKGATIPEGWSIQTAEAGAVPLLNQLIQGPGDGPVLLVSSDVTATPGSLEALMRLFERNPQAAIAGPVSNRAPKPQRVTAKYEGTGKGLRHFASRRARRYAGQSEEVPYLGAFCMAFNRDLCRQLGPLNEQLEDPIAFWEYFSRVRSAGYRLATALDSYVHHEQLSEQEGAAFDDLSATEEAMDRALAEGQQALEQGNLEAAASAFARATEQFPDLAAGHAGLATVLTAMERHEEAVSALRRAVELAPEAPALYNELGVALFRTHDFEGSESALGKACSLDPQDVQPLLNLVDLYGNQERWVDASQAIKAALAVDPNNPDVMATFGILCIELGDMEGARMALQRLQSSEPRHPQIELLRRSVETQQGAEGAATTGVEEEAEQLLSAGQAAIERGDFEAAIQQFICLTERMPDMAAAHTALGSTLMALGRIDEAVPSLRRAAELAPQSAALQNQLGVALYQQNDLSAAEAAFLRAREAEPQDMQCLLNLIDLYRTQDRYADATQRLKEALSIDPNHAEALVAFGVLSLELGDLEGAEIALQRLRTVQPDHPDIAVLEEGLAGAAAGEPV